VATTSPVKYSTKMDNVIVATYIKVISIKGLKVQLVDSLDILNGTTIA
jgi:hypothetical protein